MNEEAVTAVEQKVRRLNRRANLWLGAFLASLVLGLLTIGMPWWASAAAFVLVVFTLLRYEKHRAISWDYLFEVADQHGMNTSRYDGFRR